MNPLSQPASSLRMSFPTGGRCLFSQAKQKSQFMSGAACLLAVVLVSQFCASDSRASGAGFKISGEGIEQSERHKVHTASVTVGQSLEIVASGFVYPRVVFEGEPTPEQLEKAARGEPYKGEAGTWMFDLTALSLSRTDSEGTQHKIVLEATTPGKYTVRFVGVILGRMNVHEIEVEVSAAKPSGVPE